jgi:hypothetical protein
VVERSERVWTSACGTPAAKFLEAVRAAGELLRIHVLGLASIAPDVTPERARATIVSGVVLGALHASPVVRSAPAGCGDGTQHRVSTTFPKETDQVPQCERSIVSDQRKFWT